MDTITPLLIALAVFLPLLALMYFGYRWAKRLRERQSDAQRIRYLKLLACFLGVLLLGLLVAFIGEGISDIPTGALALLTVLCILSIARNMTQEIRQCQERLRQKNSAEKLPAEQALK